MNRSGLIINHESRAKKKIITVTLLGYLCSQAIFSALIYLYDRYASKWDIFAKAVNKYEVSLLQIGIFDLLALVLPMLVIAGILGRGAKNWGISRPRTRKFTIGLAIGLIIGLLMLLLSGGFREGHRLFGIIGLNLLLYNIIIGATEESFYRGFLQSELEKSLGVWIGSILQILLFALSHVATLIIIKHLDLGALGMKLLVSYVPWAVCLTLLRKYSGSIWGGAVAQVLIGLASML